MKVSIGESAAPTSAEVKPLSRLGVTLSSPEKNPSKNPYLMPLTVGLDSDRIRVEADVFGGNGFPCTEAFREPLQVVAARSPELAFAGRMHRDAHRFSTQSDPIHGLCQLLVEGGRPDLFSKSRVIGSGQDAAAGFEVGGGLKPHPDHRNPSFGKESIGGSGLFDGVLQRKG